MGSVAGAVKVIIMEIGADGKQDIEGTPAHRRQKALCLLDGIGHGLPPGNRPQQSVCRHSLFGFKVEREKP
jgi:hypothetical protein